MRATDPVLEKAEMLQIKPQADDLPVTSVYERLREDIIQGRLDPNERLKVPQLAIRFGTSTNPVREALQQLRGEGFVVMLPNRGARVRPVDADFVRDIIEMEKLIEPFLTRWFIGVATDYDIAELERLQAQMEALDFADPVLHSDLDVRFHRVMYDRHYNRHAVDVWWKHREILSAIGRKFVPSLGRRAEVVAEHRGLIEAVRRRDEDEAAAIIHRHVEGSGRHIVELIRARNG